MVRYSRLGHVALNVTDAEQSRSWYEGIVGLQYAGGERGERYFRVGQSDRGLALHTAARPGLRRIGWEVETDAELGVLEGVLNEHQVRWRELTFAECASTGADRGIRALDPVTGAVLDFYARPTADNTPTQSGGVKIRHLGHVVLGTPRYREAIRFYEDVLNFRTSDEIDGRINLMRCFPNPNHHSFGIAHAERNTLHHVNFMVTDEDDLSRARARFQEHGVPVVWDGHHPPSGNTFLFFLDPDGLSVEYGHGMELFPEVGARTSRVFPAKPESFDSSGGDRDARTASTGEIETSDL